MAEFITAKVSSELKESVRAYAERYQLSISDVVRLALMRLLNEDPGDRADGLPGIPSGGDAG